MKERVSENLDGILAFLLKWQLPTASFLQDGLNQNYALTKFSNIGLNPTNEILELYCWRNGTSIVEGTNLDDIQFIPGFHILSLQDAITQYLDLKDNPSWDAYWFPIIGNGGGDFYAIDFSKSNGDSAPIIGFLFGEEEQDVEYQNLNSMLKTFLECCEQGIVFLSDEGYLEMDDDRHSLVALKNNPDIEFWRV